MKEFDLTNEIFPDELTVEIFQYLESNKNQKVGRGKTIHNGFSNSTDALIKCLGGPVCHINPALDFSKCLASNGLKVTIILTTMVSKSAQVPSNSSINVEMISDGSEEVKEQESIEGFFKRFRAAASQNLAKFIQEQRETCPAKVLVYDSTMPWALDVAHQEGLLGASFFTQAIGVCAVYYHMYTGLIKYPYEDSEVLLPSMTPLGVNDLPCFSLSPDSNNSVLRHLADQFLNLEEADWIFVNTFDKLEYEVRKDYSHTVIRSLQQT
ncbi:UDP-glycosyltransferase 74E1 [Forsythia ovata]|uniref:UDP-glycosyltransferase 74E1 n=1 Tax=Forsythia ovata TaxID=205694 RepID=A0ABD1UXT9_9LAMI